MHRRSLFKNYAETSLSVVRHAERVAKVSLAEAGVRTVWDETLNFLGAVASWENWRIAMRSGKSISGVSGGSRSRIGSGSVAG